MTELKFRTPKENYEETLLEARKMSTQKLKEILRQRLAFHWWAVKAYEKALAEKHISVKD